jgi:Cys-tRNA(Pro)/Cys-tRNA(Cys) deacylase
VKQVKTNAMRLLDEAGIEYTAHSYTHKHNDPVDGISVAEKMGQPLEQVYKTLVTQTHDNEYVVFMLPVAEELDLKKCARAAGTKSLEMIHVKDIHKITGYIRGGCSPLGMKKDYRTFIDENVILQDRIYFSGGKIGVQIEMDPEDLIRFRHIETADLIKEK